MIPALHQLLCAVINWIGGVVSPLLSIQLIFQPGWVKKRTILFPIKKHEGIRRLLFSANETFSTEYAWIKNAILRTVFFFCFLNGGAACV